MTNTPMQNKGEQATTVGLKSDSKLNDPATSNPGKEICDRLLKEEHPLGAMIGSMAAVLYAVSLLSTINTMFSENNKEVKNNGNSLPK